MDAKILRRLESNIKHAEKSDGTCIVNVTYLQILIQEIKNKEEDLYSANKIIDEQIETIKKQDKMIDLILRQWKQDDIRSIEEIRKYFEQEVENE